VAAEVDKPILPEAEGSLRSEIDYFQYKRERGDFPNDVRNALLVVTTLIAAVTFQAGINPPDGVWHEITKIHVAEKWTTVYNNKLRFTISHLSNTAAFSTSISIIGLLIRGFPGYLDADCLTFNDDHLWFFNWCCAATGSSHWCCFVRRAYTTAYIGIGKAYVA
jgi:hypothetical protein